MGEKKVPVRFELAEVGLISVKDAAERRGWSVKSVQNWIAAGLIPCAVAGGGMRTVFLLRLADVDAFTEPPRGRPAGTKNAPGGMRGDAPRQPPLNPAPKPRKTRGSEKSRKKSRNP